MMESRISMSILYVKHSEVIDSDCRYPSLVQRNYHVILDHDEEVDSKNYSDRYSHFPA